MIASVMTQRTKNPIATRARILQSAGEEYGRYGFQAARLNAIVENAGITKGSLFHHFSGKDDLALQWLRETLPPLLDEQWIQPLEAAQDPLLALKEILRKAASGIDAAYAQDRCGNPLATLAASVLPSEAALHQAMADIQQSWHRAVAEALARGQRDRSVHPAIAAAEEAHFILALAMGMELQVKTQGPAILGGLLRSAHAYLDTLRPA
jgi:TetR/AcrR family transcriptional regulator, transcriptional repressor for nem operon